MTSGPPAALILVGGPPTDHDFDALGAALAESLTTEGFGCEITADPAELTRRLTGGGRRPDLVAVLALRWTMTADRYAPLRDRWAYSPPPATREALVDHVERGGGLLAMHTACICFDDWPGWGDLLGASWAWGRSSHPPVGSCRVSPTGANHEITSGLEAFTIEDEVYASLDQRPGAGPLLTVAHDGVDQPVLWARTRGAGRVVVDTLGHSPESLRHPTHQLLIRRSARWALGSASASPESGT
ncbi:MAG: ThuA domain-containing protein [Microthrixaceae bacterium]